MRLRTVLLASLVVGCSSRSAPTTGAPDASTPNVAQAFSPLDHLRKLPVRMDEGARLARVGSGYRFAGFLPNGGKGRFLTLGHERFVSTAPARSTDPVHVGVTDAAGKETFVEVVAEDLAAAPSHDAEVAQGTLVFRGALTAVDLVHVLEPGRAEELRIVHQPTNEIVTRHRISPGPSVREVRATDKMVEVLDDSGKVVLATAPIVAWDAKGQELATTISVRADKGSYVLETRVASGGHAFPVTIDPTWTSTLPAPPNYHDPIFAFPRPGNKVAFGGSGTGIELFDPFTGSTGAFTKLTNMSFGATAAALLADGKTVLFGTNRPADWGSTGNYNMSTWLYDLSTGVTTRAGDLANIHDSPNMVLVPGGKVVAYGGAYGGYGANGSIEIFDPSTKTWSLLTAAAPSSGHHTMTTLDSGKVLVQGGSPYGTGPVPNGKLLDPVTGSWTSTTGQPAYGRNDAQAIKLNDGTVLVVGGGSASVANTAEIYDPVTDKFTLLTAKTVNLHYYGHRLTMMSDGKVLITGGDNGSGNLSATEWYDPVAKTFTAGATTVTGHRNHAAVALPGGRVLIYGGSWGTCTPCTLAEIYTPDPVPSADGTGCPGGIAADGYCCDRACTGACESCNQAGKQGVCWPVTGAAVHGGTCGNYVCAGPDPLTNLGVCGKTCGSDAGCSTGNYCDLASGLCLPQKATPSGCTRNGECSSGFCVDGVCCGTACNTKICQACDVAGSVGTCTDVTAGDPHGTHGTCGSYACAAGACASGTCTSDAQCANNRYCVGGSCVLALGQGSACTRNAECQSDACVDGYCCDGACTGPCQACNLAGKLGTCSAVASGAPHGSRTCAPYANCNAGACASSCSTDTDCATGSGCSGGVCVTRKANGASCTAGSECASGTCADGVCCNTACGGACQACNLTGKVGTCSPVDGFADPHGKCTAGPCGDVCKAGACGFKSATTLCSTVSCTAGVATAAYCDGATAACPAASASPCPGNLTCASATACKTSCVVDGDCTSGVCDPSSGRCVASLDAGPPETGTDTGAPDTGSPDTGTLDTGSPDTGALDTGLADTGSSEDTGLDDTRPIAETGAPKLPAVPVVTGEFQRCTKGSECPTGHCVEGVCCNTDCKDQCHSCALLTSPGTCTLEPIGVDLKNECGPALSCLGTCGGSGECIGSGTGTQCARNRCTGPSTGVGPAYCSAPGGSCPTDDAVPFDCNAYICEPAFGACMTTCTASRDCAAGYVCDIAGKQCVAASVPEPDDNACAVGQTGAKRESGLFLALAGLAVTFVVVRRRRRDSHDFTTFR